MQQPTVPSTARHREELDDRSLRERADIAIGNQDAAWYSRKYFPWTEVDIHCDHGDADGHGLDD